MGRKSYSKRQKKADTTEGTGKESIWKRKESNLPERHNRHRSRPEGKSASFHKGEGRRSRLNNWQRASRQTGYPRARASQPAAAVGQPRAKPREN